MDYKYKSSIFKEGTDVFNMHSNDLEKIKDETWEQITLHNMKECVESKLRSTMRPSFFQSEDGTLVLRVNFSIR